MSEVQPAPRPDAAVRAGDDSAAEGPIIQLREASKTFVSAEQTPVEALRRVSLDVRRDTFVALVGPSGCGKTTIINLIAGFTPPSGGAVLYKGRPVAGINRDVGYVPQESKLFPWLTLEQNILFPLQVRGYPRGQQRERVREHLAMVGLTGFERALPSQLSGGMQKRASIIRALVYDADVLLMDEPFGALDAQTRDYMQDELLKIWQREPKTVIFVTHSIDEAIKLSDRIMIMSRRPGRVQEIKEVPFPRPRDTRNPGVAQLGVEVKDWLRQRVAEDEGAVEAAPVPA